MRLAIYYLAVAVGVAGLVDFFYRLVWFAVIGKRGETRRTKWITGGCFLAIFGSIAFWFIGESWVGSNGGYEREQLLFWASIALCLLAIIMSRFSAPRTRVAIMLGSLIVALNWVGTVKAD